MPKHSLNQLGLNTRRAVHGEGQSGATSGSLGGDTVGDEWLTHTWVNMKKDAKHKQHKQHPPGFCLDKVQNQTRRKGGCLGRMHTDMAKTKEEGKGPMAWPERHSMQGTREKLAQQSSCSSRGCCVYSTIMTLKNTSAHTARPCLWW